MTTLDILEREYKQQLEIANDESLVHLSIETPMGRLVIERPKWPAAVRQKALVRATELGLKIERHRLAPWLARRKA